MVRILLLSPPYVPNFMRNSRCDIIGISGSDNYPLQLGYCTGLLEKNGFTTKLLDAQVDRITHEKTYKIIQEFQPQLTVINYSNKCLVNDLMVAFKIRELTGSKIVFVGASASTTAEYVVTNSFQESPLIY